jgi:competence protein ComEC
VVVVFSPRTPSTEALSLVALGDLGERAQRMLRPRLAGLQPDIVKVSHHGSPDQSAELYADLDAPIALIGVGADNDYGHPAPRTLEMVGARGATIVRSDRDGIVSLHRDQGEIHIWREVRQ